MSEPTAAELQIRISKLNQEISRLQELRARAEKERSDLIRQALSSTLAPGIQAMLKAVQKDRR